MVIDSAGGNFYYIRRGDDLVIPLRWRFQLWCHLADDRYIVYASDTPIKRGSKHYRNIKRFFRYHIKYYNSPEPIPSTRVISAGKYWRFHSA